MAEPSIIWRSTMGIQLYCGLTFRLRVFRTWLYQIDSCKDATPLCARIADCVEWQWRTRSLQKWHSISWTGSPPNLIITDISPRKFLWLLHLQPPSMLRSPKIRNYRNSCADIECILACSWGDVSIGIIKWKRWYSWIPFRQFHPLKSFRNSGRHNMFF